MARRQACPRMARHRPHRISIGRSAKREKSMRPSRRDRPMPPSGEAELVRFPPQDADSSEAIPDVTNERSEIRPREDFISTCRYCRETRTFMHRARTNRAHRAEYRRRSSFRRANPGRFRSIPLIRHEFRDSSASHFRSQFALPGGVISCLSIRPAGTALSRIGSKAVRSNGKTRADEIVPEPESSERESTSAAAIRDARFPKAGAVVRPSTGREPHRDGIGFRLPPETCAPRGLATKIRRLQAETLAATEAEGSPHQASSICAKIAFLASGPRSKSRTAPFG